VAEPCTELEGSGGRHVARRMVDSASTAIGNAAPYASYAKELVLDQLAPAYWKPAASAVACQQCQESFTDNRHKHHCRACGEVVCEACSPHRVYAGESQVRVCVGCHGQINSTKSRTRSAPGAAEALHRHMQEHGNTLYAWQASQNVGGAVAYVGGACAGLVNEGVRPEYWRPDAEITECSVCSAEFTSELRMHHCRACGEGVCDLCSQKRCRLPHHGWPSEERVCDTCFTANLACREGMAPLGDD